MRIIADYAGRSVRLTDERRRHILDHPEMQNLAEEIEQVLQSPQAVIESRTDSAVALYYAFRRATMVGDKWLCVVVKIKADDAFVLTAYLTDKLKQGVQIFP